MKKVVKLLVVVFTLGLCAGFFAGCGGGKETLKIYNWNEYLDPSVVKEFQSWYQEETGKRIKVVQGYYDSNEILYGDLELNSNWDVACPSDYMIDKLITGKMLKPLDNAVTNKFKEVGNEKILNMMNSFNNPLAEYTVPYLWGTTGIMYDTRLITPEQEAKMNSWEALWDPAFAGKIYMKPQACESYTVAMLYAWREQLSLASDGFTNYDNQEYRDLTGSIFRDFTPERMEEARIVLQEQKDLGVREYDGENPKYEMSGNSASRGCVGLFWSPDAGYVMSDIEEEPGFFSCSSEPVVVEGNKRLGYVVPKEGSSAWFDGWVIPNNAKNAAAANKWIEFTMLHDKDNEARQIAKLNAEYAGTPSAHEEAVEELRAEYEAEFQKYLADPSKPNYFKGQDNDPQKYYDSFMEARFPSESLDRCGILADFGEMSGAFIDMFLNITNT